MVVGARVIGVLELTGPALEALDESSVDVLETLAIHAGTSIEAARLHEHTESLALTDVLTELPKRRRLEGDLKSEVATIPEHGSSGATPASDAALYESKHGGRNRVRVALPRADELESPRRS